MEIINYKGYKIKIIQDEDCESPNDWGDENLFLVYDHRQFTVKRDGFDPNDIYDYLELQSKINSLIGLDETQEELEDDLKGYFDYESKYWVFPVEAYIHSGVSLRLFPGTKQCRWDSSANGYILASKEEFKDLETAKTAAEVLIKTWNQYLYGDVWGFIIEKPNEYYTISKNELQNILTADDYNNDIILLDVFTKTAELNDDFEQIDSLWGFYEQDTAIIEAKSIIDNEYFNLNK